MGFTTKILLNKTRLKNDGTYPLVLRVTYNRKVLKLPMGYCVKERDWNEKTQQIKAGSKISSNVSRLNTILKNKQSLIFNKVSALDMSDELQNITPSELKGILFESDQSNKETVYKYIDQLISEKLKLGKKGTALTYRDTKRKLISVFGDRLSYFEQIDYKALKEMELVHFTNGGGKGGLAVNFRTLRAIYNRAIKEKLVSADHYPFKDYKIKSGETVRKALSESDFEKFKQLKLKAPLLEGYEYFMASFYLRGMNFIDMAYLKGANIEGDYERLRYTRNKTGKHFSIKISEPLKVILKKYLENSNDNNAYVFPILKYGMSADRMHGTIKNKRKRINQKLKRIAETIEIDPFTVYAARHTYATMGKRRGVPTAVIQESLGHKTEHITQTYLNSFDNTVVDDYDELIMM
jgi:integrase